MFGKSYNYKMKSCIVLLLIVLLLVEQSYAGLWITIPSSEDNCGSLQQDSYFWDTNNQNGFTYNQPVEYEPTVPKGDYYFYYNTPGSIYSYPSDIRQYFCTGYVDSMPLGSYCFYQNIQNGIKLFCFEFVLNLI